MIAKYEKKVDVVVLEIANQKTLNVGYTSSSKEITFRQKGTLHNSMLYLDVNARPLWRKQGNKIEINSP